MKKCVAYTDIKLVKFFLFFDLIVFIFIFSSNIFAQETSPVKFTISDKILGGGDWQATCLLNKLKFNVNDDLTLTINLTINSREFLKYRDNLKELKLILSAERIFDSQGRPHLINNNFMSTVLTPSGMPIESFSWTGAGTKQTIFPKRHNFTDICLSKLKHEIDFSKNIITLKYEVKKKIPFDLPEGYYRFQLDIRAAYAQENDQTVEDRLTLIGRLRLKPEQYTHIPFHDQLPFSQKAYTLPVFRVGNPKAPKMIWSLFTDQIFMGTQGIIAEEDKLYFKISPRHSISDRFIIPLNKTLNLEPDFPTLFLDRAQVSFVEPILPFCVPIPLDYKSGEFSVKILTPKGKQEDLGKSFFKQESLTGASSGTDKYQYCFNQYGKYEIELTGGINDIWGNKYQGGGKYFLWVANRLSFATSVKPGAPFEVGDSYPSSVFIHPPVPAQVKIDLSQYINSNKENVENWQLKGQANRFGYFCTKEKITFKNPGEYFVRISADYTDSHGTLWIGNQVGACVIAPINSKLIVHGKKFKRPFDSFSVPKARFNLQDEGRFYQDEQLEPETIDHTNCINLPLPYYSGDVMFIASTPDSANAIDATLTAEVSGEDLKTLFENNAYNYDFPEKIKQQSYFFASAIRPGIVTRTFIADSTMIFRDSYWPTSPAFNTFGNQFNTSLYGDYPQDIYRFMGGFVYKNLEENIIDYGIYASMAIILPKGSYANRIVAPLSEPLIEVNGREFSIFEAGAPSQGVIYETGDFLGIGGMVFPPIADINCTKKIIYPDGQEKISQGISNKIGILKMTPSVLVADQPGIYKIQQKCWHNDKTGDVLGTSDGTYNIYVDDRNTKKYFHFKNPRYFYFDAKTGLDIKAAVSREIQNPKITYSIIMPGCVMDEGTLPVENYAFGYKFMPQEFNIQFPNYDFYDFPDKNTPSYVRLPDLDKFNPENIKLVDLVMMTFFLEGTDKNTQENIYDVSTIMLRGNKVFIKAYNNDY
ncbi:MAG: hypothetical protein ABIG64_08975 [Candidatus Omnitrophota bacterium]